MKPITREEQYIQDMIGSGNVPTPQNRKELYLKALAEKFNDLEKNSGLPDPSSYTDGTVLVKVGSEWKAQSGYGYESDGAVHTIDQKFIPQSGALIVNFTIAPDDSVTADKSVEEIESFNGIIEGRMVFGDGMPVMRLIYNGGFEFRYTYVMADTLMSYLITYSDDAWTLSANAYTLTPAE